MPKSENKKDSKQLLKYAASYFLEIKEFVKNSYCGIQQSLYVTR